MIYVSRRSTIGLLVAFTLASCFSAPHEFVDPVPAGTEPGPRVSLGAVSCDSVPRSLVIGVPCDQGAASLHVHEIRFEFPPNPRYVPGVRTNTPWMVYPLDIVIEGSSIPPSPGHAFSYHEFDVFRSRTRLLPHDIGIFVEYDAYNKLRIHFDGRSAARRLAEPAILREEDSSFYWSLLQHDAALREAYKIAAQSMIVRHRDHILESLSSAQTKSAQNTEPSAVARPWSWGEAPEENIRRLQEIATEGLIPAEALPIPALRSFLNQEISRTVREVSTWKR